MMVSEERSFGSSEAVLRFIQERSEDIEKAVIPQFPTIVLSDGGEPEEREAGLVLHMLDGYMTILHPKDAELVLNDGILTRMRIKIELYRGG